MSEAPYTITLKRAQAIVRKALQSAERHDLSIVISVGDRCGNDLIGATEVFGKPQVLLALREEIDIDMPSEDDL